MKFLWFTLIISACVIHGVAQETPEQKIIGRWKMEARIENYAAKWSVPKWNELVVKEYFANGTYRFTYEDSTHVAVNMR